MQPRTGVDLLRRIEAYYDAAPRSAALAEDHGPLTLFLNRRPGWHYYARPRLGDPTPVRHADVAAMRERQRALGVPESFEWVAEVTPSLRAAAEGAGLEVHEHPLMVLDLAAFEGAAPRPPAGTDVRLVDPEGSDLATLRAVANLGFAWPTTTPSPACTAGSASATWPPP